MKKTKRKILWQFIRLVTAAVVFAAVLYLGSSFLNEDIESYTWDTYNVSVTRRYYDGSGVRITALPGTVLELETPPEVNNRTFKGWLDDAGNLLPPGEITVSGDSTYTAKYVISLSGEGHAAYIFPRSDGFFHLDEPMTRSDAAVMINSLLPENVKPKEYFSDVERMDDCYLASAVLKTLGVCEGESFRPDACITEGELFGMLSFFCPVTDTAPEFKNLKPNSRDYPAYALAASRGWVESGADVKVTPEKQLTREDTVRLMNTILGRDSSAEPPLKMVGGFLDYTPGDALYGVLAEAAVTHTSDCSGGSETWLTSEPLRKLPEGFYVTGTRFYCISPEGSLMRNTERDGFAFGPDGLYTSGNENLDALIRDVFEQNWSPKYTRDEFLKVMFDYTVNSFKYLRRTYYDWGSSDFGPEAAEIMLSTGMGNCYNYAATFCMFARALGYDAKVYSGWVDINKDPHGWCEITIDGVTYICDPELTVKAPTYDFYMKTESQLSMWMYVTHRDNLY